MSFRTNAPSDAESPNLEEEKPSLRPPKKATLTAELGKYLEAKGEPDLLAKQLKARLGQLREDTDRLQVCQAALASAAKAYGSQEKSVLRVGMLADFMVQSGWKDADGKRLIKSRNQLARWLCEEHGMGFDKGTVSRTIRAGELANQCVAKGLPVAPTKEFYVPFLTLRGRALGEVEAFLAQHGGKMVEPAAAKAHVRSLKAGAGAMPKSMPMSLEPSRVLKACEELLALMPDLPQNKEVRARLVSWISKLRESCGKRADKGAAERERPKAKAPTREGTGLQSSSSPAAGAPADPKSEARSGPEPDMEIIEKGVRMQRFGMKVRLCAHRGDVDTEEVLAELLSGGTIASRKVSESKDMVLIDGKPTREWVVDLPNLDTPFAPLIRELGKVLPAGAKSVGERRAPVKTAMNPDSEDEFKGVRLRRFGRLIEVTCAAAQEPTIERFLRSPGISTHFEVARGAGWKLTWKETVADPQIGYVKLRTLLLKHLQG